MIIKKKLFIYNQNIVLVIKKTPFRKMNLLYVITGQTHFCRMGFDLSEVLIFLAAVFPGNTNRIFRGDLS